MISKVNPRIKTKGLSVAAIAFLISSQAFSVSQINSEFEMSLPRQFQQTLIEKKWETVMNKEFQGNWQFPDQVVQSPEVPVQIKNISLKIKTFLQKPNLDENQALLQLSSKNLQGEINIGEVLVDHIIEKVVGGIIGRFRVQASCKNVVLTMAPGKGSFEMALTPVVETVKLGMNVSSVALSWLPGSWAIQNLQCEGAQGFTDIIRAEIDKLASDSTQFIEPRKELIRAYVQNSIQNEKIDFSGPRQLFVARPDIQAFMKINSYNDLGAAGVRLNGVIQIDFLKAKTPEVKNLALSEFSAQPSDANQTTLHLPKDFIKEVMGASYAANLWLHRVPSNKVPGFSTLMASRFKQMFVWPELQDYAKSTKFLFDIYSKKDMDIQGSGLSYQLKASFNAHMQAPRGKNYVPFMDFVMPFTAKIQLKIEKEKASATLTKPTLGLSYLWDASYVKKYSPARKFDAAAIRDAILDSTRGKTMSMAIPKISVVDGVSLKVEKAWVDKNHDLTFSLAPSTK